LSFSFLFLPIGISNNVILRAEGQPLANILLILTLSIGLHYVLFSATGPLVQRWFSLVHVSKQPYQLYSWSNLASLLALLSFPFLFEPLFSAAVQSTFWSIGYGFYCIALIALMVYVMKALPNEAKDEVTTVDSLDNTKNHPLLWLGLSTLGVVLLVSTTNAMTQNIPPIPFLWILPLCLYLLSFIISFHSPKWYVRWYWFLLFVPTALIAIFMFFIGSQFDISSQVVIYSSILFSACMICHGELAKLKPCVSKLTWFYLTLAFGGFLGSVLVAFVAQNIFTQFLEFPVAIIGVFVLFALSVFADQQQVNKLVGTSAVFAILCVIALWQLNSLYIKTDVHSERNFYGVLSVKDVEVDGKEERRLIDGTTSHGTQYLPLEPIPTPLSYYRNNTGVAIALQQLAQQNAHEKRSLNVGFVGLGAGTLAAYGNQGDSYRFYELNPAVIFAAKNYFTYLKQSKADVDIIAGDGRVSLTQELSLINEGKRKLFDMLVIDAFSGDSIPQHLLTVEALQLYWQHLNENGVIAVHISNTHLNLLPLMAGLAQATTTELRYFKTKAETPHGHDTEWVWLTNNEKLLNDAVVGLYRSQIKVNEKIVWTDDFSHLISLLK
jgi:spermidine synthase